MSAPRQYLIIGSGPSGIAVAHTLISHGLRPLIIDGGIDLEVEAQDRQQSVKEFGGAGLRQVMIDRSRENSEQKTWFGSSASYEQQVGSPISYGDQVEARATYARGGFSRVWGGTFAYPDDFSQWPSTMIPTANDLQTVGTLVPHATTSWESGEEKVNDRLVKGSPASFKFLRQVKRRDTEKNWNLLPSTVAIDVDSNSDSVCRLCSRCLSGCPYDSIWFAGDLLIEWIMSGLVEYLPGLLVRTITEDRTSVVVRTIDKTGTYSSIVAERIFLAAGAISTATILCESGIQTELTIKDSSTALGAAIQLNGATTIDFDHHGLSQWWIAPRESGGFLAQIYPPNMEHAQRAVSRFHLPNFANRPVRALMGRVHPVIAYLPSESSGSLLVRQTPSGIQLNGHISTHTKRIFKKYLRDLSRAFLRAGYLMPVSAFEFKRPGGGYHFGSSMPHGILSDHLGRPKDLKRIHIVDSSVLPTIPVGSITPTVMANAVRITRCTLDEAG